MSVAQAWRTLEMAGARRRSETLVGPLSHSPEARQSQTCAV